MKPKSRQVAKSLSKNVLQMKFMKKSALETQEKIAEDEKNKLIDNEHWYLDMPNLEINQNNITVEKSYTVFNGTSFGRLSFQGFNPDIEKIMLSKLSDSTEPVENEISAEDKDLAEYYEKNYRRNNKRKKNGNIMMNNGNFDFDNAVQNGNIKDKVDKNILKSQNKKRKFIKPNLDE
jgi:M-phase phosphoprotein-6